MPKIKVRTRIDAPQERVFDLARSIDLHVESARGTGEEAIAGCTSGLISLGEKVTWRARHLGIRFRLTSQITAFERPKSFRDSMVSGPFKRMEHDHLFYREGESTIMEDIFDFSSPFGALGALVDTLYLGRHMRHFLTERNLVIREVAESERWRQFLV